MPEDLYSRLKTGSIDKLVKPDSIAIGTAQPSDCDLWDKRTPDRPSPR